MRQFKIGRKTLSVLVVVASGLLLTTTRTLAEPIPDNQDRVITKLVCDFLHQGHLNRPEIGDEVSRRLFRKYLKDLDPAKLYFMKQDIDELKKQETELDDMLLKGDLSFAYKVYKKFVERVAQRQKLIEDLVAAPHDFTVNETLVTDYDAVPYASTEEEIHERFRKRIKFDLLVQRVGEKPVPDAEAKKKVLDRYHGQLKRWKQLDNSDLMELYLSDLTGSIDPHSSYMSPATLDDFDIAMRLNLDGIGALLRSDNGQMIVVEIVPGGAAALDGRLKPNDKIVGVAQGDGKFVDATDMKLRELVKLVRGKRGTKVQLKIVPVGKIEPVVYELTRQKIELKSQEARGEIIDQGKKPDGTAFRIGVIDLPSFYADLGGKEVDGKSATEDVRKLLKDFKAKKVDGVVLDLRRNGGGSLKEALALTGLFIDQGPIVQVKDLQGKVELNDPETGIVYAGPLVVLDSRFSASASEILAGALQDYGRALIVGDTTTHGKGTVQRVIDLSNLVRSNPPAKLGALKLTVQQFYRVNGDSTQDRGVLSDVVIPSLTEYIATSEKEMDYALPFDKVKPVEHEEMNLVPTDVKALVKDRSAQRIKESKDFAKLSKEIEQFKARKARKAVSLNEKELREQFSKDDADKIDMTINDIAADPPMDGGVYKFKRNFTNNEVLQIMEDFIKGKKLTASR